MALKPGERIRHLIRGENFNFGLFDFWRLMHRSDIARERPVLHGRLQRQLQDAVGMNHSAGRQAFAEKRPVP